MFEKLEEIRDNFRKKSPTEQLQIIGLIALRVITTLIALFLSWTCNANYGLLMRIVVSLISAVFAELYIVYYTVYHILMGVKCAVPSGASTLSPVKTLAESLIKAEQKAAKAVETTQKAVETTQSGFPYKQKSVFGDFIKSVKSTVKSSDK